MNFPNFFLTIAVICGAGTILLGIVYIGIKDGRNEPTDTHKRLLMALFVITVVAGALSALVSK